MSAPLQRRLADAIRRGARDEGERRGHGRARGTVLRVDPLLVDLHAYDLELDGDDVSVGKSVVGSGEDGALAVGDVLVLIEVDDDDWVAVDVVGG